jgi:transposase
VLYVDESGVWVCAKRLERGTFKWPSPSSSDERRVEMRSEELALLLGGLDATELKPRAWKRDTRSNASEELRGARLIASSRLA